MKNTIVISHLKPEWINDVAKIHFDALPNDFLPMLGMHFLINTFYPAVLSSPFGKAFIAVNELNKPIGFIIVTLKSNEFLKDIIRSRFWEFLKIGISSSFKSLINLRNNFQILFSGLSSKKSTNFGEIYIIAVKNSFRGKGIGKMLVKKSIDYLLGNNLRGIKIKTLVSNSKWIGYLSKEGWKLERSFQLIGKEYIDLVYDFDELLPEN